MKHEITLVAGSGTEPEPVTVAVTAGEAFLDAGRLAIEDELAAAAIPGLDTMLVLEGSSRSAPALARAERLVGQEGLVVGHANSAASLVASQIYNGTASFSSTDNALSPESPHRPVDSQHVAGRVDSERPQVDDAVGRTHRVGRDDRSGTIEASPTTESCVVDGEPVTGDNGQAS